MEVGKVSQAPEPLVVSAEPVQTQRSGEKNQVIDAIQQDFQVNLQDGVKMKLAELATMLQNRQQLIASLPEEIRKAVVELLRQMSAETELPQGLENLLKGQKNVSEQLKDMSNILKFSAVLTKDEHSEVKAFLQETLENFTKQAAKTPEQSAKELVQLAKQLPVSHVGVQGNLSQALEQFLEQTVPEKMQQLTPNEQKLLVKVTNLLGQNTSAQLQQLAKQNNVPELPGVWALLTMADARQFKDIQPKTLQAAADLLKQIVQEMSPDKGAVVTQLEQLAKSLSPEVSSKGAVVTELEQLAKSLSSEVSSKGTVVTELEQFVKSLPPEVSNKGTVAAQLEQFVKTLPPEIGKALQQSLKQGNIPDSLRSLADTFSHAAVLNENMSSDLEKFIVKNVENFMAKAPAMSLDANNVLLQLTKQLTNTNTTVEQLKTLIQQLKIQMLASDPKILEKQQHVLDQIAKLFEGNIPQVLQEGTVQHKLPELAKIWVLLKALGAEQWRDIESQNLQKSAGAVKELAQSIYKATGLAGDKQAEHSTLSFSVPLHVAEGLYYPAHIHIYHEEKASSNQLTQREFETWLRVSVDTENIGMVDSVFRLYGDNNLDIRVNFPLMSAADQFTQDLPDVRKSLENSKLTLTDVMVSKA